MSPRVAIGIAIALPVLLALAGCGGDSEPPSKAAPEPPSARGQAVPADVRRCPVTLPNGDTAPGERPSRGDYGNGRLSTVLWPYGTIVAESSFVNEDGSIGMKFGWWRGIEGELTIEGRRLDAPAPPLRAEIPKGYWSSGFQASGIIFPTEGCWEVTGNAGGVELTFVTLVVRFRG